MVRFFWLRCRYKNERLSGKDLTYGRNVSRGDICKFYRYWSDTKVELLGTLRSEEGDGSETIA